ASGTTSSARERPSPCAARRAPSAMASAAVAALRLPLNGAGAISANTAGPFPGDGRQASGVRRQWCGCRLSPIACRLVMALDRQPHQAVDERGVGHATGGPQQREHAGGREAGDGVELAEVEFVIPAEQE